MLQNPRNILVSIIMASHNDSDFIGQAVESAKAQSHRNWELIIIDDASTDGSIALLDRLENPERIRVVRLKKNGGSAAARNEGLKRAKGKYIAVLDSDDLWLPEKLEKQIAFMEDNPEVGVCGTNVMVIDAEGREKGDKTFPKTDAECREAIWTINPFCHSSTMIRKSCFDELGLYDNDLRCSQDLDLWFKLGQKYMFHNLQEIIAKYRIHSGNVTMGRQRLMIRNNLLIKRRAVKKYGYRMPIKGRLNQCALYLALLLPAKLNLFIFTKIRPLLSRS